MLVDFELADLVLDLLQRGLCLFGGWLFLFVFVKSVQSWIVQA